MITFVLKRKKNKIYQAFYHIIISIPRIVYSTERIVLFLLLPCFSWSIRQPSSDVQGVKKKKGLIFLFLKEKNIL